MYINQLLRILVLLLVLASSAGRCVKAKATRPNVATPPVPPPVHPVQTNVATPPVQPREEVAHIVSALKEYKAQEVRRVAEILTRHFLKKADSILSGGDEVLLASRKAVLRNSIASAVGQLIDAERIGLNYDAIIADIQDLLSEARRRVELQNLSIRLHSEQAGRSLQLRGGERNVFAYHLRYILPEDIEKHKNDADLINSFNEYLERLESRLGLTTPLH